MPAFRFAALLLGATSLVPSTARREVTNFVAVSPRSGALTHDPEQRRTQRFWVRNISGEIRFYDLAVGCGSQLRQCELSIWSIRNLNAGDSVAVDASFITPPSGAVGTIAVLAKVNGASVYEDSGYVSIQSRVAPTLVVRPRTWATSAPPNTSQLQRFWVVSTVATPRNYDLGVRCEGALSACRPSTWSLFPLPPYDSIAVDLAFVSPPMGASGRAVMLVKVNGTQIVADSGSVTVQGADPGLRVAPLAAPALYVADSRDARLCVAACFEGVMSYSTPAYTSMDVVRGVTLVYRSGHAKPLVTLMVDAIDRSAEPPSHMAILVKTPLGALVTQTNELPESWYQAGGGSQRLVAQFDPWRTSTGAPTGAYEYQVIVRSRWPDGTMREAPPLVMRALVVDERASPYGAGWSVAGVQTAHRQSDGSVLLSDGEGTARYFKRACAPQTCYQRPTGDFSSLSYDATRADWTRRYPDGTTVRFGSAGQMLSVTDRLGNATTYEYLSGGRLASIIDPTGQRFIFDYDLAGKLRTIQDPGGRITTFAIDAAGDLAAITDASGSASFRATYTPEHLLSTRSDGVGNVWELRYDFSRRVEGLVSPTVLVDGAPRRPAVSYRSLESAMLYGAGHGTLAQPRPRTSSDSLDAMVRVVGPRGFTTSFALGRFGAPLLVIEPGSRRTRLSYDDDGRVVRARSPAGRVVRQRYQGPDLVERWDSTAGARVTLAYEPEYHQLTQLSGDVTPAWHFWSRGRLDSTRAGRATDSVAKFTYDARNRLETMTDPAGHTTRIGYMTVGSLNTSHAQTTGMAMTSYQYDALGRLISKASDGVARGVVRYDALDRPRLTVGALGDTTRYGYGPAGLDTVIDARGQRYLYRRNALGWVESEVDPAGRAVAYRYDAAGNVVEMINRRGQSVRFTYDALDLVRSRTADEQTTTYSVDTSGFFASATTGESTDTLVMDALGRKTREIAVRSGVAYELASGYDARGRRTQIAVARPWSSTVGYHYNEASRLDELTDIAARKTTLRYDTDLLELQRTLPNNVTIGTGGYFSGHMPRQLDFTWRADLVSEFGAWYRPTPRGELADRWKRDSTGAEYQYDAGGQLTRITPYWFEYTTFSCPREDDPDCIPPVETRKVYGTATTLQYDAVGNPRGSGVVVETGNRLRRLGDYQLEYDADGNMTRKYKLSGSGERVWDQTLSWNSIGQLTTVTTNGSTVSFGYDGWGRRVRKTGPSGTARYLWDGDDLFAEVDATGNRVAEYTYYPGIDQPHSMRRSGGGQLYYYATERPGHVVALLDASGSVVDHYEYSPFGELTVGYGTVPNTLRYGAREHDGETGLYYNRARYYDPALRRFVSEDPLGLQAGINQYAYAGNAPLDARDPTGLCKIEQMVLEVGADGVAKLRCPEGQEYELRPSVITGERDYFADINTYVKDLMSRTDKLREEAASAVVRRQQDFANAIYQARDLATVQSLVFMMTVDRLMQDPWYSTRTCWASLQQRFAKETVKGALGGIVTAAARNYSLRAPLKQGVGAAGTGGAAVGLFFAIDGVEAVCQ